jgi:hypothetical protein
LRLFEKIFEKLRFEQLISICKILFNKIPKFVQVLVYDSKMDMHFFVKSLTCHKGHFTVVTKGRNQSLSCIVIGGKVGAGPSSLYTSESDQGLQWMKK